MTPIEWLPAMRSHISRSDVFRNSVPVAARSGRHARTSAVGHRRNAFLRGSSVLRTGRIDGSVAADLRRGFVPPELLALGVDEDADVKTAPRLAMLEQPGDLALDHLRE